MTGSVGSAPPAPRDGLLAEPWSVPAAEVVTALGSDQGRGLSGDEARARLERYGRNEVEVKTGPGPLVRFLLQFHQPLIYILLASAAATALLGKHVDSAVIFAVVVLNALLGYLQESRALAALDALSRTLAVKATVVRDGERHAIPAAELVPGDVVVLEPGDKVPADLRLVASRQLQIDEAAITGESVPAPKQVDALAADSDLGDRTNMAYSSTLVTYGRGTGVVVATGSATEVGRISELIESAEEVATPLTRRIAWFSRVLLVVILVLAAFTFGVGLWHGLAAADAFLASVALAVAGIPEGLPAVITITLAIGVSRMARRRAIIRKLPAVETLGSTTVVCSDKTGTLTENQMTVQQIWVGGRAFRVEGAGYEPAGEIRPLCTAASAGRDDDTALERCLVAGALCNDASLVETDGRWSIHGDPTEGALIVAADKAGLRRAELEARLPRLDAVPFESELQYMATLHAREGGDGRVVFAKGSDQAILQRCSRALGSGGEPVPLDAHAVQEQVRDMAAQGLRVLAFAEKAMPAGTHRLDHGDVTGLTLLGLQGMIDPPRQEAMASVAACKEAGIAVKMITGDHAVTASAIAAQLGIGAGGPGSDGGAPRVVTGAELVRLSDRELYDVAGTVDVFARVPPEGKLKLVRALQARGHVVAMTGDGVNDGPALRQADIGVAMGVTGTEVAREASDMVLTDDNFASIVAAVEEGRAVFDNLTKFLTFILPTSLGQSLVVLIAILFGATLPMLPVHVLWVNMTTAVFLGLMLAFEPREHGVMKRPPRPPKAPLLTGAMGMRMLLVSGILVGGAFGLFTWAQRSGLPLDEARTIAVNVFIVVQVFYLLNCRSLTRTMFAVGVGSNRWIAGGIAVMAATQLAFTYAPPFNALFQTAPISLQAWLLIAALGVGTFVVVEVEKYLRRRLGRPAGWAPEPGVS
jgi:Ca2+-transporting ATPase